MINRYLIIDDFYGNPDELARVALDSVKKAGEADPNFGGVMTLDYFLGAESRETFQKLTLESSINSATPANGRLRFTKAGDAGRFHIHFDFDAKIKWAGVVYLSKDHPKTDGTCFWQHRETGLEAVPKTQAELAQYGWENFQDLTAFIETEGRDESRWKKTLAIPYRYNRLVLYRPWLMHSSGPYFGDRLDNARVVQTLYFGS